MAGMLNVFSAIFGKRNKKIKGELREILLKGNMEKFKELLKKDPELASAVDDAGSTPLHYVSLNKTIAYHKDLDDVMNLEEIVFWSNTDLSSGRERTPLHSGAQKGDLERCRMLISRAVEVNVQDQSGKTPLHYAGQGGHLEVAKFLVASGADLLITDNLGRTPAGEAGECGQKVVGLFLLEKEEEAQRALDAIKKDKPKDKFLEVALILLALGADPNCPNKNKITPLHMASGDGQRDIAEALITEGAEVNIKNKTLRTPLHLAASHGHISVVELLLDKGAQVESRDNLEVTPLHLAAAHGFASIAESLISRGANVNARDIYNATPLLYATNEEFELVADVIRKNGGKA